MKYFKIIPGLIICILIAYIGQFLGSYVPSIGGASIAIFLGILLKNTLLNNKIFEKGSTFAESDLLSYSIVLLGGTLSVASAGTSYTTTVSGVTYNSFDRPSASTFSVTPVPPGYTMKLTFFYQ